MNTPPTNELKIAVIGAGHLGKIHARLLAQVEGVKLMAVADPVADSRKQIAAETGAAEVADYRELIGHIDAVILAAPASLHHAIGMELLQAGIHTLMEKPLAVTVADADELVWAADWHGAVLQVGHIERFNPALTQVRPLLREPRYIRAVREGSYTFRSTDIGAVLDLMIHDIDLTLSLVDSPLNNVSAIGLSIMGQHEDVAHARLEFASGAVAELSASRVAQQQRREMQVWSPQAHAIVDFNTRKATVSMPADVLADGAYDEQKLSPDEKRHLQQHFFSKLLPTCEMEAPAINALLEEQRDFVAAIREGRSPLVSGAEGRSALAVAERILTSIAAHRWESADAATNGPLPIFVHTGEPSILRGPHWDHVPQDASLRREAG
jgi:predicted dehydrogenase